VHTYGFRSGHIVGPVVNEQAVLGLLAKPLEGEAVKPWIGLQQLFLARHHDIAKAAEKCLLARRERGPEFGREVGDREQGHSALAERLYDGMNPGDRIADGLAETRTPGVDGRGMLGEVGRELGRGGCEGGAAVKAVVPCPKIGVCDKARARILVGDLAGEKCLGLPCIKDVADIEDDGGNGRRVQPWRALKRRLVLLIT